MELPSSKNKIIVIAITVVVCISVGISASFTYLTNESIPVKKTLIYEFYLNHIVSSEKDDDGNDVNQVKLLRAVYPFDSLRGNLSNEYYYSNGTVIFSQKELYAFDIQCGPGTVLLYDMCIVWHDPENLESGETKHVIIENRELRDAERKIVKLEQRIKQLEELLSEQ